MAADRTISPCEDLEGTIESLRNELREKTELVENLSERMRYLQADFDNYRKNFEKEKGNIISLANEGLIKDLLVIVDDFERALQKIKDEKTREGLAMLYKKFLHVLEEYGLAPIDCIGKKFDPYYHEAMMKEACDEESDTILEEYEKGYKLKSKVIRPSKVKIAENISEKKGEFDG